MCGQENNQDSASKLPNADQARVDREKIIDYLLNENSPRGAPKAAFFSRYGFDGKPWWVLAGALREHAMTQPVVSVCDTHFGLRFNVEGPLQCIDGRCPNIRTVWQIDNGEIAPRLITAYPAESRA
jgi:hypothetical protein